MPASTSTSLLTDMYELTMLDAALKDGTAHRRCTFELFGRRLPATRRFGVVAGTGRIHEARNCAASSEMIPWSFNQSICSASNSKRSKASEIFSTAEDGQPSVLIQVYQGEREFARDNKLLGTFELSGIAPAPRGVPQIEVTFDIDANGIVHVSAKDRGTGKEQSVTITGGSSLPKEDIDRMVREAEEHAAEDKKRREEADTRNQAEQAVYSTEKLLKDEADKISEETRAAVQKDVDAVKEALKGDDIEAVKTTMATLSESGMKIGQEIYAKQQADEAGAQSAPAQDDVVDAEIVDEDGK